MYRRLLALAFASIICGVAHADLGGSPDYGELGEGVKDFQAIMKYFAVEPQLRTATLSSFRSGGQTGPDEYKYETELIFPDHRCLVYTSFVAVSHSFWYGETHEVENRSQVTTCSGSMPTEKLQGDHLAALPQE